MAKFIRHDYSGIHDALNEMIIAEVKAALMQLPEKAMETERHRLSLCRVVVSEIDNYQPEDVYVKRVWLNDGNGLCFSEYTAEEDEDDVYTWTEDDDLLDITDFGYLIDQIAEQVEGDKTVILPTKTVLNCDIAPEFELKTAIEKTI